MTDVSSLSDVELAAEIAEIDRLERVEQEIARSRDVFAELGYTPTPRQAEFHAATEWDVLYGGAAGGGKTRALLVEGLRACVKFPGIKVMAVRESYPQLAESFLDELSKVGYARVLGGNYTKNDHDLTFVNGSVIRFRYCDGLEDAKVRLGTEMQLLLVDEATRQDPAAIDFLSMRLRSSNPTIPVLGVRLASNPGGVGHGWAKARYIDGTNYGSRIFEDVVAGRRTGHLVRFIPARYTDNPHVPDYEQTLNAIKDDRLRAAYRDGSWDTFAGQVFIEWARDRHVIRPFSVPVSWRRVAGIDWGFGAPWAVLWAAADEDGRVFVYREMYETQVGEAEQAHRILWAEGAVDEMGLLRRNPVERVVRWADPSIWARRGDAGSIAEAYTTAGCVVARATNDRIAGWQRVHSYLGDGPACRLHRGLGWTTCPMLHVFDTCEHLIRTLPVLPADVRDPEDVDTNAEDHAADALRYLLMSLPLPRSGREGLPEERPGLQGRVDAHLRAVRDGRRRSSSGDTGILGRY